jgi:hypothetical protein
MQRKPRKRKSKSLFPAPTSPAGYPFEVERVTFEL